MIKNEYKDPIILNIDDQDAAIIRTGAEERLYHWKSQYKFKIRTEKGRYYNSIQKEIDEIRKAAAEKEKKEKDAPFYATVYILKTSNILDFKYRTTMGETPPIPKTQPPGLLDTIVMTNDITPLLQWMRTKPNYERFSHLTGYKLIAIENAIYHGTNQNTAPMNDLKQRVIYLIGEIKRESPRSSDAEKLNKFISRLPLIIHTVYNNMYLKYLDKKITFNSNFINKYHVTQALLEQWRNAEDPSIME